MQGQDPEMKFIYGAGKYGRLLLRWMIEIGVKINYFVQTNEPQEKKIEEIPVISFRDMKSMKTNKTVFIAINDNKSINEIRANLYADRDTGSTVKVYNCRNFINDNLLEQCRKDLSGENLCIICGSNVTEFYSG